MLMFKSRGFIYCLKPEVYEKAERFEMQNTDGGLALGEGRIALPNVTGGLEDGMGREDK